MTTEVHTRCKEADRWGELCFLTLASGYHWVSYEKASKLPKTLVYFIKHTTNYIT